LKAVRIHEYGAANKLRYEEAPVPELSRSTDVVVRLHAASLNHIDIWNRRGLTGIEIRFPRILGADGAGTVADVGAAVKGLKSGDPVCLYPPSGCGDCEFCASDREWMCIALRVFGEREDGTYAEYVRAPARNCFPIPRGFSFEEAAAFPLVYLTIWRMLQTNARLKPGEHILILGIGGGVATAALQIAAAMGTHIIVTSSSDEKLEKAKALGAAHGINYTKTDFAQEVRRLTGKRGVDVVVDCVGGSGWVKSLASLAKGGRLVTCGATAGAQPATDIQRIFWNHLKIFGSTLGDRTEFMEVLSFLAATGIRPIIDRVFPLRDAALAQQWMEDRRQFGKIVLRIAS
jgi:NADPH:quinone reductase-like Zn-dependent oxidoreductase